MTQEEVILDLASRYHAGQQVPEIAWFWDAAKKINPKVVVEIGIYGGGNLKILSTLVTEKDGLVVGMEYDWSHWKETGGWDFSQAMCPIHLLDGDTHKQETKNKLLNLLNGRQIDVLFIDGDHSFNGCKQDFDMYGCLVRDGGIIAIHDTQMHRRPDEDPNVRKCGEFFDALPEPKFEKHVVTRNWDGYGIGYFIKQGELCQIK